MFAQDQTGNLIKQALVEFHGNIDPSDLDFYELWDMLANASESSTQGQVICVLDALDECTAHDRDKLITKLDRFYKDERSSSIPLKFLITSRAYDDIVLTFKPLLQRTGHFRFDADDRYKEISHDIGLVIEARIGSFASDLGQEDRQRIVEALKSRGTNTYLWLYLTLELMQGQPSLYSRPQDVDALIAEVPTKLSDVYEKMLNRSKSEQKTSALLQIMLAAKRPLTVDEANYALTLATADIEIKTHAKLEEKRWKGDFESIVKNLCGLLVSVYDGKLSFIHLTARQFLLEKFESGSDTAAARWQGRFADPAALHMVLTRCCMQYLFLSDFVSRQLPTVDGEESKYGLLLYAAQHWAEHFQELDEASQSTYLPKARQLCSTSLPPLRTWGRLYIRTVPGGGLVYENFYGWSDLAVVSLVGLQSLVEDVVGRVGVDVNELCEGYGTALHAAVARNQESIAAYLISKGAEVDAKSNSRGSTPLDIAVSLQHYHLIKLLLANGASPLEVSKHGYRIASDFDNKTRGFRYIRHGSYTILACAAMLPDKDIFYMMLASLVDIGSPRAILVAAADQRIIDSGDVCRALLLDLLDDKRLGSRHILTESLLPVLFSVPDVGCRALRLLKQQNRQAILISKAILQLTMNMSDVEELLVEFLTDTEEPCASITQDVLEIIAEYYQPDTLRVFIQFSPKDSCTIKNLILPAVTSRYHRYTAPFVVLEFARADIAADEELQRKLLKAHSETMYLRNAIVLVFLKMPRLIAPVKKMLIHIVLTWYEYGKAENEALLLDIMEHDGDQDVVDDKLLVVAANETDTRAVRILLDRSSGLSMADERYLKAAAGNCWKGNQVMQFLLSKYGEEAAITPYVVRIAAVAARHNDVFEFLLETRPNQVPITADIIGQIDTKKVLKLVLRYNRDEMAKIAPQALRRAVNPFRFNWEDHLDTMQNLLECCSLSWFEPTEALILDILERSGLETIEQISLLINTFGDKIDITDSIIAAATSSSLGGEVPDIFKNWKPELFKVTPWIVEKVSACGSTDGLNYLAHASGGALIIESKWYRLASFRGVVAGSDFESFKEKWEDGTLDFNMADAYGKTALHVAAADGEKLSLVCFLLDETRTDIHATDRRGWTALHFAVYAEDIELVQTLLEAGADPYHADLEGKTPVSIATDSLMMTYEDTNLDDLLWILKDEWYSRFMALRLGMDDDEDVEELE